MRQNDKDKKERVIHTRVSEVLDDELRDRAAQLGVSVSNLVRNVLLNTFGLVENIVADTARAASAAAGVTPPKPRATENDVLGWQTLTLNVNALCKDCNALLPKGTEAAMGITASGPAGPNAILCTDCVKKVGSND